MPFIFFAGLGIIIFFLANAYLLGRQYFEFAAMRFHPPAEAKALRKTHAAYIFLAGMTIAVFVSIPLVNLATPIFAMAYMVHIHKRMAGKRAELMRAAALTVSFSRADRSRAWPCRAERSTAPGLTVRTLAVTPMRPLILPARSRSQAS